MDFIDNEYLLANSQNSTVELSEETSEELDIVSLALDPDQNPETPKNEEEKKQTQNNLERLYEKFSEEEDENYISSDDLEDESVSQIGLAIEPNSPNLEVIKEDEIEESLSSFINNPGYNHDEILPDNLFDPLPNEAIPQSASNSQISQEELESYLHDPEKEKILLEEIDKFLQLTKKRLGKGDITDPLSQKDYDDLRFTNFNSVDLRFKKFLIKRRREINFKEAVKVIQEQVRPRLQQKNERILKLKEEKINEIKSMRKWSKFSKGEFENVLNENLQLKKEKLELVTMVKLLKVELRKTGKKNFSKEKKSFLPNFKKNKSLTKKIKSTEAASNLYKNFNNSSRASTQLPGSFLQLEELQEENMRLKREKKEMSSDFKIKMGRMKNFYDKHLQEFNSIQLNKKTSKVDKKENQSPSRVQNRNLETQLINSRLKIKNLKEKIQKKENEKIEIEKKMLRMRNEVQKLTRNNLKAQVTKLETKLEERDQKIENLKKTSNIQFYLENEFGNDWKKVYKIAKMIKKVKSFGDEDKIGSTSILGFFLKKIFGLFSAAILTPLKTISTIWNAITAQISNFTFDRKKILIESMKNWRKDPSHLGLEVDRQYREITKLKIAGQKQREKISELELKIQQRKIVTIYGVDIFSKILIY